jgi:hypothetical protein
MHIGVALEAATYQLAIESGVDQKKARNENYETGLAKPGCRQIPTTVLDPSWEQRSRDAFMAAKHSDAPQPPFDEQIRALDENILAFRYWLARRLGVPDETLSNRL